MTTIKEVKEAASKALSHPLLPRHAAQAIMGLIEVVQAQGEAIEAMQQRERPCKCSEELLQFPPIPSVEELQVSPGLTD